MNYTQLSFSVAEQDAKDTLMAMLSNLEFEGFEETAEGLNVYIETPSLDLDAINEISTQLNIPYTTEQIAKRNWNEEWEKNFEPVIINGFCSIRADFHPKPDNVEYDIVITPKMSFGTGHHATTASMMTLMKGLDFKGKNVFDFGTGTGILAILAEQLGAASVLGIDNDEWSIENAVENCGRNKATKVDIQISPIESIEKAQQFDIILANINRHILLEYMNNMFALLKTGGTLLLSGILQEDIAIITTSAANAGFSYQKEMIENNWVCMQFGK
ncbi:50S ribosomal protein L11 methyltransferase [Taibaiella lutea]|uniref:Ribosomal protein L11 methyltransferase n=1 Tax=Taibaiella lutea TaxID=2608001 RepID=A0A5M6CK86_9BACT|nr:50S ribosomal protein L11 methyltransferase [Taibaiella lutea]KAA5533539.1 50S ribosomal protein L11 methyltransferase [Taibaiella lutea]